MWYRTTLPPQLMPLFYLNSSIPSLVVVHSEGVTLTLTPDEGTTLNISQSSECSRRSKCTVCTGTGLKKSCSRAGSDYVVLLTDPKAAVNMVFTCTKPEEVFTVEVVRGIGKNSL